LLFVITGHAPLKVAVIFFNPLFEDHIFTFKGVFQKNSALLISTQGQFVIKSSYTGAITVIELYQYFWQHYQTSHYI
jgi:hypothetical protein